MNSTTKRLAETAVMIAIAAVLSVIKIVDLPYGGSVTVASMLPIVIIAIRYGTKWGVFTGFVYGVIQQLLGLKNLSYVTTWQSILAVMLFDYLIAFAVIGFAGLAKKNSNQAAAFAVGGVIAGVLRYVCHIISGATVWAGLSIPTGAALAYSVSYNGTYMIPETIVLALVGFYIGSRIDFRGSDIRVFKAAKDQKVSPFTWIAGLLVTGALVFDLASIFANLQNADSGEFDITGLAQVNFTAVIAVTAVCAVLAVVCTKLAKTSRSNA